MQLSFFNLIKYYSIYSLIQRECTYYITWKFKSNVSFLLETICDKFNFNINPLIENNIFSVTITVLVFNVCVRLVTCTLDTNISILFRVTASSVGWHWSENENDRHDPDFLPKKQYFFEESKRLSFTVEKQVILTITSSVRASLSYINSREIALIVLTSVNSRLLQCTVMRVQWAFRNIIF